MPATGKVDELYFGRLRLAPQTPPRTCDDPMGVAVSYAQDTPVVEGGGCFL